jgi:glycosyltransferase involved in cell wall biosynthesis
MIQKHLPRISVVMPTFNALEFVREALTSIRIQNYPDLELIIVDGGSKDNTLSVVNEFKDLNPIIVSEKDFGLIHAVNKGVMIATGDYINWLNADDLYFENALLKVGTFLSKHPNVDLLYGDAAHVDKDGKFLKWHKAQVFNKDILLNQRCYVPCQATFFKRSSLAYIGLFDTSLLWAGDWDMWKRFAINDDKFRIEFLDEKISKWRLHRNTISFGGGSRVYFKQHLETYRSTIKYKTVLVSKLQIELIPHILVGLFGLRVFLRKLRDYYKSFN